MRTERFRVIAIIAAFNEGDVIFHVIRDLIENDVDVYLIDNKSTDNTIAEASRLLGKGLLHIEQFPDDTGGPARANSEYAWKALLNRKEQLAYELNAEWFIHADADEFRESLWPDMRLAESIKLVDQLGYNAIEFQVLNFRPVNDNFVPGQDVRKYLTAYEPPDTFDDLQIKAWKRCGSHVDLAESGGHEAKFENRRIFPFRFPMRHYPIRSASLGRKKVLLDRLPRFMEEERAIGWHVQYDKFRDKGGFIWQEQELCQYDPLQVRAEIVARTHESLDGGLAAQNYSSAQCLTSAAEVQTSEQLCHQMDDERLFLKLYNLASSMEKSGQRDHAGRIFELIASLLPILNPDLAGKANYKLALLSEETLSRIKYLNRCLSIYPSHNSARKILQEIEANETDTPKADEEGNGC